MLIILQRLPTKLERLVKSKRRKRTRRGATDEQTHCAVSDLLIHYPLATWRDVLLRFSNRMHILHSIPCYAIIPPGSNLEIWALKMKGLELRSDATYGGISLIEQRIQARERKSRKG